MTDAYEKTVWINESTKLNADNLNHIEEGIKTATDGTILLENEMTTLKENIGNSFQSVEGKITSVAQTISKEIAPTVNTHTRDIANIKDQLDNLVVTVKVDGGEII